jgi:hypothetical protein
MRGKNNSFKRKFPDWNPSAKRKSNQHELPRHSIFTSALYRSHAVEWVLPQEKAALHADAMSAFELKMLERRLPHPS